MKTTFYFREKLSKRFCSLIAWLFIIAMSSYVKADNSISNIPAGTISGIVKDKTTGNPIEYTSIILYKQLDSAFVSGTITDSTGLFLLNKIPEGTYYIRINFMGYQPIVVNNISISSENKQVSIPGIQLEQQTNELNGVNIVSEKSSVEFKIDKKIINVAQQSGSQGSTVADILQNTPSVQVDADDNILLRGSSNYTLLINGKPTPLAASDVIKNTPASSIENIEIITNPSAKYDAQGMSGIINLVMKKKTSRDLSGNISASAGTGEKYMGNIMLSVRKSKTNYYAGADYSSLPNNSNSDNIRLNYVNNATNMLNSESKRVFTNKNIYFTTGMEHDFNDINSISIDLNAGEYQFLRDITGKYHEQWIESKMDNYVFSDDSKRIKGQYVNGLISYTHKFGKPDNELKAEFYANVWNGTDNTLTASYNSDDSFIPESIIISKTKLYEDNKAREYRMKIDYNKTFKNKNRLEAGAQSIIKPAYFNYTFDKYDPFLNKMIFDNTGSSEMNYNDNIHAVYTQYSGVLKGFDYQAGLRMEYTDRNIEILKTKEEYKINRPDYFPSAYIYKSFGEKHQLQISYSRRINRPQDWNMVPYPLYSDAYSRMLGNPALKPELIDAYELNYLKILKKNSSVSAGLFLRNIKDPMGRVLNVDTSGTVIVSFVNQDWSRAAGSELSLNLYITKWLTCIVNGNIYHFSVSKEQNYNGKTSGNNFDFSVSPNIKIGKNTKLSLMFMYNSASVTSQGTIKAYYAMNTSLKRDFLKQKLTVSLNARNIFKSLKYTINAYGENYSNTMNIYGEGPVITFGLSYKINNYKPKNTTPSNSGPSMSM